MERLTTRAKYPHGAEGVSVRQLTGNYCRGVYEATAVTERLAEYEDTGLTPEQIREIDRLYAELCQEIQRYRTKWVPVASLLPGNYEEVLVTMSDGYVTYDRYDVDCCEWDSGADDIVAWMPFPEPYREQEGTKRFELRKDDRHYLCYA